jgi:hypothetical protein
VYFDEPTAGAIRDAFDRLETTKWEAETIIAATDRFSESRFRVALHDAVDAMAPPVLQ